MKTKTSIVYGVVMAVLLLVGCSNKQETSAPPNTPIIERAPADLKVGVVEGIGRKEVEAYYYQLVDAVQRRDADGVCQQMSDQLKYTFVRLNQELQGPLSKIEYCKQLADGFKQSEGKVYDPRFFPQRIDLSHANDQNGGAYADIESILVVSNPLQSTAKAKVALPYVITAQIIRLARENNQLKARFIRTRLLEPAEVHQFVNRLKQSNPQANSPIK